MHDGARRNLPKSGNGVLNAFLHNQTGSVLPILAMGTVVLAGLVGGGVDMARGYKAERRLQAACDAGVLAGRRAVGQNGFDTAAKAQAQSYFNANFDAAEHSMTGVTFTPTTPDGGDTVAGVASGKLSTMIMAVFGFTQMDLSVACSAQMGIGNADIMFVLDNTASMDWKPESNSAPSNASGSRIAALKLAMKSFYDTVKASTAGSNARIRYGFVPYANTVNVGKVLKTEDPSYLADSITVPSLALVNWSSSPTRTWSDDEPTPGTVSNGNSWTRVSGPWSSSTCKNGSGVSQVPADSAWQNFGVVTYDASTYEINFDSGLRVKTTGTHQPQEQLQDYECRKYYNSWTGKNEYFVEYRRNTRDLKGTNYAEYSQVPVTASGVSFAAAILQQRTFDTTTYKTMASTTIPVGISNNTKTNYTQTTTWNGCIQERQTTPAPTFSFVSLLTGITASNSQTALDLDIDSAPTSDPTTRWQPQWWQVTFGMDAAGTSSYKPYENLDEDKNGSISDSEYSENVALYQRAGFGALSSPSSFCPYESQLLEVMTESAFDADVDAMETSSYGTYHDTGLLWGARLSSPTGIFADNVNDKPTNGGTVSRHLIFMTDGDMEPMAEVNGLYGMEQTLRRVSGSAPTGSLDMSALELRHVSRGRAICEAIKARGIRLWVIAFGTSLTSDMSACASPDSAFQAGTSTALTEKFQEIANQVGELRVTQ